MSKEYGRRLRLSKEEEDAILRMRGATTGSTLTATHSTRADYEADIESELSGILGAQVQREQPSAPQYSDIPDGVSEARPPYVLETDNVLFLPDIHAPFQCAKSLNAAIELGQYRDAQAVVIGGDYMDNKAVGRFRKPHSQRNMKWELDVGRAVLAAIRGKFPKAEILFMDGNHDERISHYFQDQAGAFDGVDDVQLDTLLRFENLGIQRVKDQRTILFADWRLSHGHEFGVRGGVNVAQTMLSKVLSNTVFGHFHQKLFAYKKDAYGRYIFAEGVGCLCKLSPDWTNFNNWINGCWFAERDHDKVKTNNYKIIDGEVL